MIVFALTFGFPSNDFLRGFDCFGALPTNASLPFSTGNCVGMKVLGCAIMFNDLGKSIGRDGCCVVVFLDLGPGFKPAFDVCFDPGFGPGFCFTLTDGICETLWVKFGICISGAFIHVDGVFGVIEMLGVIVN